MLWPSNKVTIEDWVYCTFQSVLFYFYFIYLQMSHAAATALCRAIKIQCEFYPSRDTALCLDPYSGLGFCLMVLKQVREEFKVFLFLMATVPVPYLGPVHNHFLEPLILCFGLLNLSDCTCRLFCISVSIQAIIPSSFHLQK